MRRCKIFDQYTFGSSIEQQPESWRDPADLDDDLSNSRVEAASFFRGVPHTGNEALGLKALDWAPPVIWQYKKECGLRWKELAA